MRSSIRLSIEIERRLDALAEKTGRSKACFIRESIRTHIDDIEDYYLAADAVDRLRKGQGRTFTAREVRSHLGLSSPRS